MKKTFTWARWGSYCVHNAPCGIWYYGAAGHSCIWTVGKDLYTEPQTADGFYSLDALLSSQGVSRAQCQQIGTHSAK